MKGQVDDMEPTRRAVVPWVVLLSLAVALATSSRPVRASSGRRVRVLVRTEPQMRYVPAGPTLLGTTTRQLAVALRLCAQDLARSRASVSICSAEFFRDEQARRVVLPGFWLDTREVTRGEYLACVRAGACPAPARPPKQKDFLADDVPVVGVTWYGARAYCRWRGKRLPTAEEWEKAARGVLGRIWPWGDSWITGACNHGGLNLTGMDLAPDPSDGALGPVPPGRFAWDKSPYGLWDMAGNVAEWTATPYSSLPARSSLALGAHSRQGMVVKGGAWYLPRFFTRSASVLAYDKSVQEAFIGFRCARSAR